MIWPLDECAPTVWVHITLAKPRTYKIWQIFLKLCKYTNPTENKHTETVTHSKTAAIVAELFYKITTIYKCLWHWTSQCPIKKQCQANHAPYMSKTLRRAVMSRSQPVTKYLKTRTQTDVKLCSKLYKSEWRQYFESSHMKHGFECKEFWKTMKIFLFNKNLHRKNNRIISNDFDLPENISIFCEDPVRLLNVKPNGGRTFH